MGNVTSAASRESDQFNLRLPEGLRPKLKVLAAQNRRSMNSELIYLVERGIKAVSDDANAVK